MKKINLQKNNLTLTDFAEMNKTRKKIDGYLEDLRNNQDSLVELEKKLENDSESLEMLVTHNSELQKNMKVVQSKISLLMNQRTMLGNNCRELHSMIKRYTRRITCSLKIHEDILFDLKTMRNSDTELQSCLLASLFYLLGFKKFKVLRVLFSNDVKQFSLSTAKNTLEDVRVVSLEGQIAFQKIELEKIQDKIKEQRLCKG